MAVGGRTRGQRGKDGHGLIWTRKNVIVTTGRDPRSGRQTYYIKFVETDEIFELGEIEYRIWKAFEHGVSLDAAESWVAAHLGDQYSDNLRGFVAELALRGLLEGGIPRELLKEFTDNPRLQSLQLRFPIDPEGRDPAPPYYRFLLFEPNAVFSRMARWLAFMKHSRWPIVFIAVLGGFTMLKHTYEFHLDFPPTLLSTYGIPHALFTILTINLVRCVTMGVVMRHYGARVRYFSLDIVFGVWPRFHVDKKGMLRLKRTPQLWAHSSPFFVRLAFFGGGALGWWWFRQNGSILSPLFLLAAWAGLADMVISAQPFLKSETYYWFCAYFDEPYLHDRAIDAVRSVFLGKKSPFDLRPIEKAALTAYALSVVISSLLVVYFVIGLAIGYTGKYRGVGLAIYLGIIALFTYWFIQRQARRRRTQATRAARRRRRRNERRDDEADLGLAPIARE